MFDSAAQVLEEIAPEDKNRTEVRQSLSAPPSAQARQSRVLLNAEPCLHSVLESDRFSAKILRYWNLFMILRETLYAQSHGNLLKKRSTHRNPLAHADIVAPPIRWCAQLWCSSRSHTSTEPFDSALDTRAFRLFCKECASSPIPSVSLYKPKCCPITYR
jgi:hypothetical protein